MAAVSDFSTKVSRHVSQRFHSSIAPLTEANLYRHTITSPPSRDAKLKHILSYVEMQRELIAQEEEMYRSVTEKGRWRNTLNSTTNNNNNNNNNNNPTRSDIALELHSSQLASPHLRHHPQQQQQQQEHHEVEQSQQQPVQYRQQELNRRASKYRSKQRTPPPGPALSQQQVRPLSVTPRHPDYVPDGLDPTMALPRALPRSMTHHDQTLYRDSFYSGIGHENDWRQLEELDPDSLAGIHIYGDASDLQQHLQRQPSSATPSSPLNRYPIYEYSPTQRNADWHQDRHAQLLQQQAIFRQLQYPYNEDDDEFEAEMATKHHRQHSVSQAQHNRQHQHRQPVSPPPTFVEEKKPIRFSSRFSFLTRRRQGQHQRHESMPTLVKDAASPTSKPGHARFHSLTVRPESQAAAASGVEEEHETGQRFQQRVASPASRLKGNSRVKQMFKDVFGITSRKKNSRSPESPFRDISLPSTHIRTTLTPSPQQQLRQQHNQHYQQHYHQQHLDPSIHSLNSYSAALLQRKGLVTPVSRTETAQSNYCIDNSHGHDRIRKNPRESLVDPIQAQHSMFQKMELEDNDGEGYVIQDASAVLQSPFAQTSLTPPPASSALRHSTSAHRIFNNGNNGANGEYEPVLISSAAALDDPSRSFLIGAGSLGGRHKARRSSQLMPTTKDYIDSGCDSMGGHEPCATASNATTLNHTHNHNNLHNHPYSQQQSPNPNLSPQQQQQDQQVHLGFPLYNNDRSMTLSMYDNGPTIVSIAQVQKVDLEGLRQSHHHHSPTLPSHHLGMVAVESPFA